MEFQLPLHPNDIATLLDNSTHWLRSVVQFKWSVAERELYHIRVFLIEKNQPKAGDIKRDVNDLWKARSNTKIHQYKKALSEVRDAYIDIAEDRNTITHGRIEFPESEGKVQVADSHLDSEVTNIPVYQPGHATMSRHGKHVTQNATTLRKINQKADRLLHAVYALWIEINPRYVVKGKLRIENASSPTIGLDQHGTKETTISGELNLSDILGTEPVENYICNICKWICTANPSQNPYHCNTPMVQFTWRKCPEPECNQAAIKNGPMCGHMALAEHYENGSMLAWTMRIPNAREKLLELIEKTDPYNKDDLIIEIDLSNQAKYWWVTPQEKPH